MGKHGLEEGGLLDGPVGDVPTQARARNEVRAWEAGEGSRFALAGSCGLDPFRGES